MLPQYLQMLAGPGAASGGQTLADALSPAQGGTAPGALYMSQFQPAMSVGIMPGESGGMPMPGIAGGNFPGYDPNGTISGGVSIPRTQPVLASEQNVNKLAMAPIDPGKLAAMLGLGGGQGQQNAPHAPGSSPAAGRGAVQTQQLKAPGVQRPGALGGGR